MQWNGEANAGFSSAPADRLYLPVDADADRPDVAAQEDDPSSLLNAVRGISALRRKYAKLFSEGVFEPLFAEPGQYPFIYLRRDDTASFLVAINPVDEPREAVFKFPGKHGGSVDPVLGQTGQLPVR